MQQLTGSGVRKCDIVGAFAGATDDAEDMGTVNTQCASVSRKGKMELENPASRFLVFVRTFSSRGLSFMAAAQLSR